MNTTFVAALAGVLVLVFGGVALVGYRALQKSGEDHVKMGDQAAAEGKWIEATRAYSRAVAKNQANAEWMGKWIDAMERRTFDSQTEYTDFYFNEYVPALQARARLMATDVPAHRKALEEVYQRVTQQGANLPGLEAVASLADDAVKQFEEAERTGSVKMEAAAPVARYRGLARVRMLALGTQLPRDQMDQTLADLRGALQADPSDADAALAIAEISIREAARARQARDEVAVAAAMAEATKVIDAFLEKNPQDPKALFQKMGLELTRAVDAKKATGPGLMVVIEPHMRRFIDALKVAPPERAPATLVAQASTLLVRHPEGRAMALEALDAGLKAHPNDPILLLQRADTNIRTGSFEDGIADAQKVLELPRTTLSLNGLVLSELQTRAVIMQVDAVFAQYKEGMPKEEIDALVKRVTQFRATLAERAPQEPRLQLIDGRTQFITGQLDAARVSLSAYNTATASRDIAGITLLADLLMRQGNMGGARSQLEQAIQLDPNNVQLRLAAADISRRLGDIKEMENQLTFAAQIEPENAQVQGMLRLVREAQRGATSEDPVVRLLSEVGAAMQDRSKGPAAAAQMLRQAIAQGNTDPRLSQLLAQLLMSTGDRPGALAVVRESLAKNPGLEALTQLETALSTEDPVDGQLALIDSNKQFTEIQRTIMRHQVLTNAGRTDQAKAELEKAKKLEPDNRDVIEIEFVQAVNAKDMDTARAIAARGTSLNADRVNGMSYQARLAMIDSKWADAEQMLTRALEIDPLDPGLWKLKGDAQVAGGRLREAGDSYAKSLEVRPTDVPTIKARLRAAVGINDLESAISVARGALSVASSDEEFVRMWLELEGSAPGGDRARAIKVRESIAASAPDDRANNVQLVSLYLANRQFAEAKPVIDALRAKEPNDPSFIEMQATWHALQGDVASARTLYEQYIASIPEKDRTDAPYMALARVMGRANNLDESIKAMREGVKYQDPKKMTSERELAIVLARFNRHDEAIPLLEKLLAAGAPDEGFGLVNTLVTSQMLSGKLDDAERTIAARGEAAQNDVDLIVLRAMVADARGDEAKTRQLLDDAVKAAPNSPLGYFRRAEFLARKPETLRDAADDMTQAVRIDPRFPGARSYLAQLHGRLGEWDRALDQLRQAVNEQPMNDSVRLELIQTLLQRGNRDGAAEQVEQGLKLKPTSVAWLVTAADIFSRAGDTAESTKYLARAWDIDKSPELAQRYVSALLLQSPPNTVRAREVLATPGLSLDQNPTLLLLRARVAGAAQQRDAAQRDMRSAVPLFPQTNAMVGAVSVVETAGAVIPEMGPRLTFLRSIRAEGDIARWMAVNISILAMTVPSERDAAIRELTALAATSETPAAAFAAARALAVDAYGKRDFNAAAAFFRRCVDLLPENGEAQNNLAYVLGVELSKPEEALPHAERAVALLPNSSSSHDTLGAVQLALGKLEQADAMLTRSMALATRDSERIPVLLHQSLLRSKQGNAFESRQLLERAEDLLRADQTAQAQYADLVKKVREQAGP